MISYTESDILVNRNKICRRTYLKLELFLRHLILLYAQINLT